MSGFDDLQKGLSDGIEKTRPMLNDLKLKAMDIGEKAVLNFEIQQLVAKKRIKYKELGELVYFHAAKEDFEWKSLKKEESVKIVIDEIAAIDEKIAERNKLLDRFKQKKIIE